MSYLTVGSVISYQPPPFGTTTPPMSLSRTASGSEIAEPVVGWNAKNVNGVALGA